MSAPPRVRPDTINRLVNSVYPGFALLAGMQLDVFTPLAGGGPKDAAALAGEMEVRPELLDTVLYALASAGLLTVEDGRFSNTPEASRFLVRGSKSYIGSNHEVFADLWSAALRTADTVRAGAPQAKHDFAAMSPDALRSFFRGLDAAARASARKLRRDFDFAGARPPPRRGWRLRRDRGRHVPGVSGAAGDGGGPAFGDAHHLRVHRGGGAWRPHRHPRVQRCRGGARPARRTLRRGRASRLRAGPLHGGRGARARERRPRPRARRAHLHHGKDAGRLPARGPPNRWRSTSSSSTSTTTGGRTPSPSTASGSGRRASATSSATRSAKATAS